MLDFEIDHNSPKPVYAQIVSNIESQIQSGVLKDNDALPSMNDMAALLGISMETVKKAYKQMRDSGMLVSSQGLGYFVHRRDSNAPKKILLLFHRLSSYKLVLYRSIISNLDKKADVTIVLHNQDFSIFENLLNNALDRYDYYIIVPHFTSADPTRMAKVISRIPNRKLIILDKDVDGVEGNFGLVTQDFEQDAYDAIKANIDRLRKYSEIRIIAASNSLYHNVILRGLSQALAEGGLRYSASSCFKREDMVKGTLFIVVGGHLDTEHFSILRSAKELGFKLGSDIGLLSYNDSPENEFIGDGLASLSTDFEDMGRVAATMINTGVMVKVHNKFNLIPRSTL